MRAAQSSLILDCKASLSYLATLKAEQNLEEGGRSEAADAIHAQGCARCGLPMWCVPNVRTGSCCRGVRGIATMIMIIAIVVVIVVVVMVTRISMMVSTMVR